MEQDQEIIKNYTLSVALCEFVEYISGFKAIRTVQTYTDHVRRFMRHVGDKPVALTTIMDVSDWNHHLRDRGYHDSSVAYAMVALRQFFMFLFLRRKVLWSYEAIRIPKYVSRSFPPVQTAEARKMIDSIKVKNFQRLRDKTIMAFMFGSGLRVAELANLRLSELKLEERYGNIISKKNRLPRMVFWDDEAHMWLMQYIPERKAYAKDDFLFVSMDRSPAYRGGKLSTRSFQRLVESCRTNPNITPHSFRHGLGMRAVKSGVHPRYIQRILGHKNINSSQIYMDTYDEDVVKAYRKIAS